MRCVFLSLVMGCGLFLGCAGPEVATAVATEKASRPERPKYPAERVLIVLDASASMGQQGADVMLEATQAILDSLSLTDTFALAMTSRGQVFLYKTKYESVTNETVDAALKWAANQPTGGATDLAGAIQAVLSLRGENKGRAQLMLLTDGQNNIDSDRRLVSSSQREGLTVWAASPAQTIHPKIEDLCLLTGGDASRLGCMDRVGVTAHIRRSIQYRREHPPAEKKGSGPKLGRPSAFSTTLARERQAQRRVEDRLRRNRISVRLDEQEFRAVVEFFREVSGLNLYVNWGELENDNPDIGEAQVTLQLKDVSLKKCLEVILEDAGHGLMELDYVIEGAVIRIGTRERLNEKIVFSVYNVHDLLHKESSLPIYVSDIKECFCQKYPVTLRFARTWGEKPDCPANPTLPGPTDRSDPPLSMQLLELIKLSVANESWYPNGTATLAVFDGVLIVSQTHQNHRDLRELLARIRRAKNLPMSKGPYRSVESIYDRPGQLAPWTKQLLQAVADGTLSPHSTLVRSKRDGAEYITLDGVTLRVPKP
jgi:hypothetical protein